MNANKVVTTCQRLNTMIQAAKPTIEEAREIFTILLCDAMIQANEYDLHRAADAMATWGFEMTKRIRKWPVSAGYAPKATNGE